MERESLKTILQGSNILLHVIPNLTFGLSKRNIKALPDRATWEEERTDILERCKWLCKEVITDPETLVNKAPKEIDRGLRCEWAMYCCSMLAHAITNIEKIYPGNGITSPELIAELIEIVNTPTLREYDTKPWGEDAMETLDGKKSHMTYLSILAWIITNYKAIGGDGRYDSLLHKLCETLNRRMLESKYDLNLLSFPGMPIWMPDMLVTIVALHNYNKLYDGKYGDTIDEWLDNAKTIWRHPQTGLLAGQLPGQYYLMKKMRVLGSHTGLICSYLSLVDEDFAFKQYRLMCQFMRKEVDLMGRKICGIKEFMRSNPKLRLKAGDAGIIVKGLSAGGTTFALGAATFFEDWEFRYQILRTAELVGCTKKTKGMRHYRLSEIFLVGEATALAMRTNIKR